MSEVGCFFGGMAVVVIADGYYGYIGGNGLVKGFAYRETASVVRYFEVIDRIKKTMRDLFEDFRGYVAREKESIALYCDFRDLAQFIAVGYVSTGIC